MIGQHHLILGTVAAGAVALQMNVLPWQRPGLFALALMTGGVAALLPDLDTQQNQLRRTLGVDSRRRDLFQPVRALSGRALSLGAALLPHRGPTHWPLTALVLAGALRALTADGPLAGWLWPVFLAGYLSHLLADAVTKAGIPLLAPLSRRPVRLLPRRFCIRTGSQAESLLVRTLLLAGAGWFAHQMNWLPSLNPILAAIG